MLDLEEVLAAHEDELTPFLRAGASTVPEWLQELRNTVAVRLIDTERLTGAPQDAVGAQSPLDAVGAQVGRYAQAYREPVFR